MVWKDSSNFPGDEGDHNMPISVQAENSNAAEDDIGHFNSNVVNHTINQAETMYMTNDHKLHATIEPLITSTTNNKQDNTNTNNNGNDNTIPTTVLDASEEDKDKGSTQNLAMAVDLPKITTTDYRSNRGNENSGSGTNITPLQSAKLEPDDTRMQSNGPIIEIATYSDVDVYECYLRGSESQLVMRRVKDDWVNITQVLKMANFSKAKRSRILEREVVLMKHEKVQGGYGRFQGTWISLDDSKSLVQKYGIQNKVVLTIINFKLNKDNPPKKRLKNSILRRSSPGGRITSPSSYKRTPKKNKQNSYSKIVHHTNSFSGQQNLKTSNSSIQINPSPLHNLAFQTPRHLQLNSQHSNDTFEVETGTKHVLGSHEPSSNSTISGLSSDGTPIPQSYASSSQKPLQFYPIPTNINQNVTTNNNNMINANDFSNSSRHTKGNYINRNQYLSIGDPANALTMHNISLSSMKVNSKQNGRDQEKNKNINLLMDQQTGEQIINNLKVEQPHQADHQSEHNISINDQNNLISIQEQQVHPSQYYLQNTTTNNNDVNATPVQNPLSGDTNHMREMNYRDLILHSLTIEVKSDGICELPQEIYYPPPNFNANFELDAQRHTAVHWSAAMANIQLLKVLLALNANPLYCNDKGFNAISKSVFYNNNFKCGTFRQLLSILNICLVTPDNNGRTPLHYLVELSINTTKDPNIINTYIDQILDELGKRGPKEIQRILNYQDNIGNTVLHLCALNSNLSLFNKFYSYGCSADLLNAEGKTPLEIMATINATGTLLQSEHDREVKYIPITYGSLEPEVLINKPLNGSSSNNNHEGDLKSSFVPPTVLKNTDKSNSQKLMSKRQYLSFQNNDESYAKANNTSLTLSKEDVSVFDDIITSSVLKGNKIPLSQSILQSPIVQSRLQSNDENIKFLSTFLRSPSPEQKVRIDRRLSMNKKMVSKVGSRINNLSKKLVDTIDNEISNLHSQISNTSSQIKVIYKNIKNYQKHYKYYCSLLGVEDVKNMRDQIKLYRAAITQNKKRYIRSLEKCQALNLANFVQKEETASRDKFMDSNQDNNLKDAVTLTVLQFKKHLWLKKLSDDIINTKSLIKINKYKQLIGMSFENIDSKLDEIEADLKASN